MRHWGKKLLVFMMFPPHLKNKNNVRMFGYVRINQNAKERPTRILQFLPDNSASLQHLSRNDSLIYILCNVMHRMHRFVLVNPRMHNWNWHCLRFLHRSAVEVLYHTLPNCQERCLDGVDVYIWSTNDAGDPWFNANLCCTKFLQNLNKFLPWYLNLL